LSPLIAFGLEASASPSTLRGLFADALKTARNELAAIEARVAAFERERDGLRWYERSARRELERRIAYWGRPASIGVRNRRGSHASSMRGPLLSVRLSRGQPTPSPGSSRECASVAAGATAGSSDDEPGVAR
jgi:hypothetical protein